jgi:transposase
MLQLTPQSRIFVATEPVDFRKGIDGLAAVCRRALGDNPLSGALYVFRNRAGTTLKILCYDGQGYWLSRTVHNAFLSAEDGGDALSVHDAETAPGAHAPDE